MSQLNMPMERFFTLSIGLCIETWDVRPDFTVSIAPTLSHWPVCSITPFVVNQAAWQVLSSVSKELGKWDIVNTLYNYNY